MRQDQPISKIPSSSTSVSASSSLIIDFRPRKSVTLPSQISDAMHFPPEKGNRSPWFISDASLKHHVVQVPVKSCMHYWRLTAPEPCSNDAKSLGDPSVSAPPASIPHADSTQLQGEQADIRRLTSYSTIDLQGMTDQVINRCGHGRRLRRAAGYTKPLA
jgi:hypothetical protein